VGVREGGSTVYCHGGWNVGLQTRVGSILVQFEHVGVPGVS